jgi:hypothetical protein
VLGAAGFHQSKGRYLTILIPSPTGENKLGSPIIDVSLKRCDCIDAKSTISRKTTCDRKPMAAITIGSRHDRLIINNEVLLKEYSASSRRLIQALTSDKTTETIANNLNRSRCSHNLSLVKHYWH